MSYLSFISKSYCHYTVIVTVLLFVYSNREHSFIFRTFQKQPINGHFHTSETVNLTVYSKPHCPAIRQASLRMTQTSYVQIFLKSVENAVSIVINFGSISGLSLNKEKTKAMWLGESANNRNAPLQLKWVNGPTRFLHVILSYDLL